MKASPVGGLSLRRKFAKPCLFLSMTGWDNDGVKTIIYGGGDCTPRHYLRVITAEASCCRISKNLDVPKH